MLITLKTIFIKFIYTLGPGKPHTYKVAVVLDGREIAMEIDTGAAVSLISEVTLKKHFSRAILKNPTISLRTYMAKPIAALGELSVRVKHNGYKGRHTLCDREKWPITPGKRLAGGNSH